MQINLKTAVSRLFSNPSFEMIYIEAVANAIDAEATKIDININFSKNSFSKFTIKDNGNGFGKDGRKRFSSLMETKDNSHKGQGRLVYLHYFDTIHFNSTYIEKDEAKTIDFNFDYSFDESKIKYINGKSSDTGTEISFKNYALTRLGKAEYLDADYIKTLLLEQFMPCLQKLKEDKKLLTITIHSTADDNITHSTVSIENIPDFKAVKIEQELLDKLSNKLSDEVQPNLFRESLTLYYHIQETTEKKGSIATSFAIDNRSLSVDIIDRTNYIEGVNAIFFITSKGFNGLVDGSRQELKISDADSREIKTIFKTKLNEILSKEVSLFSNKKKALEKELDDKYPHLHGYLPLDNIGFASKTEILNDARDKFFREQRDILEKEHLTEDDYKKALELSSRNLAEYIIFRQKQIDKLKDITGEDREKAIHELVSPQRNIDNQDSLNIYKNNAWVLDDRFMSFSNSFSDTEFNKISEIDLFEYKSKSTERPDFLMLFSKPLEQNPQEVDIVIFEFKRLNVSKYDKTKAGAQLTEYADEIREICKDNTVKIGKIWLYALVDIDDTFRRTLRINQYKQRFSVSGETWNLYNDVIDAEITFLDFNSLIKDAEARNKTFIDILKNNFDDE